MEEAAARRERLRALRQAAGQQDGGAGQQDEQQADKPVLKFRNYVMQDSNIQHEQVRWLREGPPCRCGSVMSSKWQRANSSLTVSPNRAHESCACGHHLASSSSS